MDQASQRLFIDQPLVADAEIVCTPAQANYLNAVLRLGPGVEILVFDGMNGEWLAEIIEARKGRCRLNILKQVRPQIEGPDIHYLFAPLKRGRLDYMVQKATELGVAMLKPVMTRRTVASRVNLERMHSNAIEAAEQCGVLRVPVIAQPERLDAVLADWDPKRLLIYCDETAPVASPIAALGAVDAGPLAVLCGPEGGFDEEERDQLSRQPFVRPISLGPRVMRADTAAVAALALVNAVLGDWR